MPRSQYPLALVSTAILVAGASASTTQAKADDVPLEIDGVCCYNFVGK
jgi:hypothetical protein